jgi:hypothetical protein
MVGPPASLRERKAGGICSGLLPPTSCRTQLNRRSVMLIHVGPGLRASLVFREALHGQS